jgi:hypothetical protein
MPTCTTSAGVARQHSKADDMPWRRGEGSAPGWPSRPFLPSLPSLPGAPSLPVAPASKKSDTLRPAAIRAKPSHKRNRKTRQPKARTFLARSAFLAVLARRADGASLAISTRSAVLAGMACIPKKCLLKGWATIVLTAQLPRGAHRPCRACRQRRAFQEHLDQRANRLLRRAEQTFENLSRGRQMPKRAATARKRRSHVACIGQRRRAPAVPKAQPGNTNKLRPPMRPCNAVHCLRC